MKRQLFRGRIQNTSSQLISTQCFTAQGDFMYKRLLVSNLRFVPGDLNSISSSTSATPNRLNLGSSRVGTALYVHGAHSNPMRCSYTTWSRTRNRHLFATTRGNEPKETKGTVVDKEKEKKEKEQNNIPEMPATIITQDDQEDQTGIGKLKKLRKWIVDGVVHYWEGSKQLGHNIAHAVRLLRKLTEGQTLTRRERGELLNTATDVFRLVPFAVFVIVPFMEFLLPAALKLFPNMLPSTFQDKLKKEEDMKRQIKLKLSMASFLQDALNQMSQRMDDHTKEFLEFMDRVQHGQPVKTDELHRYANIFSENFTLLDASQQRPLLISMCKFLGLNAYGTNSFLRWQIRMKLGRIREDDKLIAKEGVKSLSFEELQQACADRGMIHTGLSKPTLRDQIEDWLRLSLSSDEDKMSVLLLSRALVKEIRDQGVKPEPPKEEDKTLLEVADAVSVLSSEDALHQEREELEKLKGDLKKIEAKIDDKEVDAPKKEVKTTKRLEAKLEDLLEDLEGDLQKAELEVGDKLNIIDKDKDGVITTEEIAAAVELLRDKPTHEEIVDVLKKLDLDQDGKIALKDVEKVMKEVLLQQKPDQKS